MAKACWMVLLLCGASLLCACGRAKQDASLALEEARLTLAAAKNFGAQAYAPELFKSAEASLAAAENAFSGGRFRLAESESRKAVQLGGGAIAAAEKKAPPAKAAKGASAASPRPKKGVRRN